MLSPDEMGAQEAKDPEVFPRDRAGIEPGGGSPPAYRIPQSAAINAAIANYRRWRAIAVRLRSGDPGYSVATNAWRRAHDRLARHLRRGRVYVDGDGLRYLYDAAEDSLTIAPALVYAKKDREKKADVVPTADAQEQARHEAAHHAWAERRAVRRERPQTRAAVREERPMLMVQLQPLEAIYLPAPDGRELKVEAPAAGDGAAHMVRITIPALNSTDRVEVVIGGRRIVIAGAAWKSGRTRLALDLPPECHIRYRDRERNPLKWKDADHA